MEYIRFNPQKHVLMNERGQYQWCFIHDIYVQDKKLEFVFIPELAAHGERDLIRLIIGFQILNFTRPEGRIRVSRTV